jgi:two-component system sensor histidine kinase TctE
MLVLLNAVLSYYGAREAVNRAYDRSLTASLKGIAEGIHSISGRILVDIPYAAFDTFESGVQERIFYAVIAPDGTRITGYPDLAAPAAEIGDGQVRIVDTRYNGEAVRLGVLGKRMYDPALSGGDTVLILFAETTEARQRLARDLFMDSLRRQFLLILAGAAMLLFALTSAFRPLLELQRAVRRRDVQDLTPVPDSNVPSEVRPLILAINHHMERLTAMVEARRRFLADAAHQIRTPLSVLSTQAEYGQRQTDPAEMRSTFAGLLQTIRGTRRMANQMLTLSQAEPANDLIQDHAPVNLVALAREVALDLAPVALARRLDLSFEEHPQAVMLHGDAGLLREMIANLVDNAIRYSPAGGHVTVAVGSWEGRAVLRVQDTGPGIPEAERGKVFRRFYRILGHRDTEGSGLGLAIVREICLAHGGSIQLKDADPGPGLVVEVEFPLDPSAQA